MNVNNNRTNFVSAFTQSCKFISCTYPLKFVSFTKQQVFAHSVLPRHHLATKYDGGHRAATRPQQCTADQREHAQRLTDVRLRHCHTSLLATVVPAATAFSRAHQHRLKSPKVPGWTQAHIGHEHTAQCVKQSTVGQSLHLL